jgi:hypothetical protein
MKILRWFSALFLIAGLLLNVASKSHAQRQPIRVAVGVKSWFAKWNLLDDPSLSWGFMAGPYVSISTGGFVGTLSYAYTLAPFSTSVSGEFIVPPFGVGTRDFKITRQDINIIGTYYFTQSPRAGIFINLKFLPYSYKVTHTDSETGGKTAVIDESITYTSFGLGGTASYAFRSQMFIFGYAGLLYNTSKDINELLFFTDFGFGYRFFSVGFRIETGTKSDGANTTLGPTFTFFYTF